MPSHLGVAGGAKDAPSQRKNRYLPASSAHPAKMLPAIAKAAIEAYTSPGDIVCDPMCGIGTTLVEAIHLGRDAVGIEYEPRWAEIALANLAHAHANGANGNGEVLVGDGRHVSATVDPALRGLVALVLTSPPYGPSCTATCTRLLAAACTSSTTPTPATRPTWARSVWTSCYRRYSTSWSAAGGFCDREGSSP